MSSDTAPVAEQDGATLRTSYVRRGYDGWFTRRMCDRREAVARLALVAVPAVYALIAAADALRAARPLPLDPDAEGYFRMGNEFGLHTLGASIREPVWPLIASLPLELLGPHPTVLRALGLVVFPLLVVNVYLCISRYAGVTAAWIGSLIVAASPWLAQQSVRGLREVPAAAGTLLFLYALTRVPSVTVRRAAALGGFAALLALLRWDTVLLTLPLLGFVAVRTRMRLRPGAVMTATFVALVAPLLIGNALVHDDPMRHSNIHAIFFRNIEFAGQPGYPTTEDLQKDAYQGPQTTWPRYLFVERDPTATLREVPPGGVYTSLQVGSLGIFGDGAGIPLKRPDLSIVGDLRLLLPWVLLGLAAIGAVSLIRRRQYLLPLGTAIAAWQLSPIATLMDLRLGLTVFPLLIVLSTVGLAHLVNGRRATYGAATVGATRLRAN